MGGAATTRRTTRSPRVRPRRGRSPGGGRGGPAGPRGRPGRRRRDGRRRPGPAGDAAAADLLRAVGGNAAGPRARGRTCATSTSPAASPPTARWAAAVATTWRFAGDTGTEPARAEVTRRFVPSVTTGWRSPGSAARTPAGCPVWLAGPVVGRAVDRGVLVVVASGQGSARPQRGRPLPAAGRRRRSRSCAGCCRRGAAAWSSRCPPRGGAGPRHGRRARAHQRHRRRHRAGRRLDRHRLPGARVRQPRRLRAAAARRGRRSCSATRPSTSPPTRRAAPSRRGCSRASPTTSRCATSTCRSRTTAGQIIRQVRRDGVPEALPGPGRVRHRHHATSARRTRAPGWPACCWPTRGGERALVRPLRRRRRRRAAGHGPAAGASGSPRPS